MEDRSLTFGEKAVGLSFNPSGNSEVQKIKELYAKIIDQHNEARKLHDSPEQQRMYSVAITEAQTAQMWAVKAATWEA